MYKGKGKEVKKKEALGIDMWVSKSMDNLKLLFQRVTTEREKDDKVLEYRVKEK